MLALFIVKNKFFQDSSIDDVEVNHHVREILFVNNFYMLITITSKYSWGQKRKNIFPIKSDRDSADLLVID
jgi:hypothetical protein